MNDANSQSMGGIAPSAEDGQNVRIDPITLSIVWSKLLSIVEEMGGTLRRTAYSPAVREGDDFSTGLFDRKGRLIAQGQFSPAHIGAMPNVIRNISKYITIESLVPGDVVLFNDSTLGSGHYPDFFLIMPVFIDGQLVGYSGATAHHIDTGGATPGSQEIAGVSEAYQEGLRLLPVLLFRAGELDEDILRVILGNVRVPDLVQGDLFAQRNSAHVGMTRLLAIFDEYGEELVENTFDEILIASESRMREYIRALPDGSWEFEDFLDDSGPGSDPVRFHVRVTVDDGDIELDFSGGNDQVSSGINSYYNFTRAWGNFTAMALAKAIMPQNEGTIRPIKITAREGSFFNAVHPAPSGGRATNQVRLFEVVNGALAQALPHRAMGAFTHWSNPNIGGFDDRKGKPFVQYDLLFGGYGGQHDKDGEEGMAPLMNCTNIPVEVYEHAGPLLVQRLELRADSGGAGKFRGGLGLRKDIILRCEEALATLLTDRRKFAPFGVFGGKSGEKTRIVLTRNGEQIDLETKETRTLQLDDVLSLRLSGAGGYGDPAERDAWRIEDDIADGYITEEGARRDYGVEIQDGKVVAPQG
ncbi:MAG: 5-oxoprolinase [Alphaproteobacteria bacterium]|nr:5-oxoprolinase [Alphaproteobacteria bacterium]